MHTKGTFISVAILIVALTMGCSSRSNDYLGDWVERRNDPHVGFYLGNGGLASSIGQPATQYTKWNVHGKKLILHGKHYERGEANPFSDTLVITHFTPQQMTVWNKNRKIVYVRPADIAKETLMK